MGSLPNLHELGKEDHPHNHPKVRPQLSNHGHTAAAAVTNNQSILTDEERNRILHRHSTHCKGRNGKNSTSVQQQHQRIIYDDFMLEQMAAYSPVSSRSTRNLTHQTHNVRRRDSISSSIGANSVRKLIAVLRNTSSRSGPVYSRRVLLRNLIILCVSHSLITASFMPFLALQASVSTWTINDGPNNNLISSADLGAAFLALTHFAAAISTLLAPLVIKIIGINWVLVIAYSIFVVFHLAHLYPIMSALLPLYVVLGLSLGPLCVSRISFLMILSNKLNFGFTEEDEETRGRRKSCIVRRVARSFQAAQDLGLIIGSILTALIVTASWKYDLFNFNGHMVNNFTLSGTNLSGASEANQSMTLDGMFNVDELGDRICGSSSCPISSADRDPNGVLPSSNFLISFYGTLTLVALVLSLFLDKIRLYVYQDPMERGEGMVALRLVRDSFKDVKLQLAAPLAVFIGLEQVFMFADFTKSYVVCTLGIHRVNWVFLCMGLLQSIAACTLSMLLRSIRRYYVIAVGFMFHACLLMVQLLWKPMGDDPALFYVISAAWGVCNAIWEMMNFTLLTGLYVDHWEAPFVNTLFFRFLGMTLAFAVHNLLCNWIKLYFLAFWMLVAVIPFAWLERRLENMRRVKNVCRL